jgi:hypothetical protein
VSEESPSALAEAERLPHVDEHTKVMAASAESAWTALLSVVEVAFSFGAAAMLARALGCADVEASGARPLGVGSTCPGFHVAAAEEQGMLALVGRHRFSSYALIFRLEGLGTKGTRLRAETRAEFPGVKGRLYRALVIGTRAHVIITRGLLAAVERRVQR